MVIILCLLLNLLSNFVCLLHKGSNFYQFELSFVYIFFERSCNVGLITF